MNLPRVSYIINLLPAVNKNKMSSGLNSCRVGNPRSFTNHVYILKNYFYLHIKFAINKSSTVDFVGHYCTHC